MKELSVSLDIETSSATLTELSSILGSCYSSGSHESGALRPDGTPFRTTIWRFNSSANREAPLIDHLLNIASQIPTSVLGARIPVGSTVCFNVGVFFDTAMCTVEVPKECADLLSSYGAALTIVCYPTSDAS